MVPVLRRGRFVAPQLWLRPYFYRADATEEEQVLIWLLFESSGHGLFYEEKDKFNTELINFVG
jgi:hypothetical protein